MRWIRLAERRTKADGEPRAPVAVPGRPPPRGRRGVSSGADARGDGAPILKLDRVTMQFGGLKAVSELATAVYFSTTTYATIGFSDAGLSASWRLVAAIEGINGILLLGWSTAFFVGVVARLGGARPSA